MWLRQLRDILIKPAYLLIAVLVAGVVFTLAVWLPNIRLISMVLFSDTASVLDKVYFLTSLYGSIGTNFTTVSASYTIAIVALFGINSALLTYYIRKMRGGMRGLSSTGAAGIGGLVSGVFGIGCATCGTFIITSALALFGATGFLAFLPLRGGEFGFVGVGLLMYSVYAVTRKIDEPMVCEITHIK